VIVVHQDYLRLRTHHDSTLPLMRHLVVKIKAGKFVIGDLIGQIGILVLSDALHQALSSTPLHV